MYKKATWPIIQNIHILYKKINFINKSGSSNGHSCCMYESSSGSTNPSRLFPLVSVSDIGGGGRRRERSEAASKLEPYRKHLHSCATTYQTLYILQCNVYSHDISEAPFCVCKENISEAVCTIKTYYIILKALTHC